MIVGQVHALNYHDKCDSYTNSTDDSRLGCNRFNTFIQTTDQIGRLFIRRAFTQHGCLNCTEEYIIT